MNFKVSIINNSDLVGGAARAAYRIHHALRKHGIESQMLVNHSTARDWTVTGPSSKLQKAFVKLRPSFAGFVSKLHTTGNPITHSPAIAPTNWHRRLNVSDADVVNLHWVNGEMMSIADIGRIDKPVVWTLHDMWAFCGAEHVTEDFRWREGYTRANRPSHEGGFDLNRWTWARKRKHWQRPMHIITPSNWLADCARQSMLMRDWPITVVPNTIDTDVWQPIDKLIARRLLGLPLDAPLLLFGAMGGGQDRHKGFDLLQAALKHLGVQLPDLELVVFGQLPPPVPPDLGFPVHYIGHIHDDVSLRLLYSAADVMAIPSRIDNLPNTGVEAHACGTPVVAFNTCGLPDIVVHQETGYLANAFQVEDLAHGIVWVMNDKRRHAALSLAARQRAVKLWSNEVVSRQYKAIYQSIA